MRPKALIAVTLFASLSLSGLAFADNFSTSAVSPGPLPASGSIAAGYPTGGAEAHYYFTANLKAGVLASQIAYKGAPDSSKMLELTVTGANGREVGSYYIKSFGENYESARAFKIDNSGTYTIKLGLKGPEAASFKVDLGGTSVADKIAAAAAPAAGFSTSFIAPSPLPADGVIGGTIPTGRGYMTSYYFAVPLKGGKLITQIGASSSGSSVNMVELSLLKEDGDSIDSYYTKSFEKNHEATRTFSVDNSGTYILKLVVQGAETTKFKAEVGGSAMAAK